MINQLTNQTAEPSGIFGPMAGTPVVQKRLAANDKVGK